MNLLFPLSCSLRFLAGSHSLWWTKWPGAVRTAFSLGVRTALRPAHRPEQYVWKIPRGREMDTVLIPAPLWLLSAHPRAGASVDPSAVDICGASSLLLLRFGITDSACFEIVEIHTVYCLISVFFLTIITWAFSMCCECHLRQSVFMIVKVIQT